MRLKTGRTFRAWRAARTAVSVWPVSLASRASEKPSAFSLRRVCASNPLPLAGEKARVRGACRRRPRPTYRPHPHPLIPSPQGGETARVPVKTISSIWRRNHGSYEHAATISSTVSPCRNAWAMASSRSGVAMPRRRITAALATAGSSSSAPGITTSSKPVSPVSRPRKAFCTLSLNVRPMAITSPTDFMLVVSVASAPGYFSKAKRGILVTT